MNTSKQQTSHPQSTSSNPSSAASSPSGSTGRGGSLAPRRSMSPYGSPSLFGGGPFELLRQLDENMDRLFDEVWGGPRRGRGGYMQGGSTGQAPTLWNPQLEMYEQDGKLHVCADLPGVKKDDVKVSIEGDSIVLQGERRSSNEGGDAGGQQQPGYYRSERSYGSFYRSIPLPEGIDADTAKASFKDGVLDVCFDAPRQAGRSRQLEISDQPASPSSTPGTSGSSSAGTH